MNRASHQLLAGPALPQDENGDVGRRDLLDLARYLPHDGSAGDETPEGATLAQLAPQPMDLARRLGPVQGSLEEDLEARGVEWLGQVVVGALLHRLDRALDGALAREHDDRRVGVVGPQGREEGETVHAGHDEVTDHDGGRLLRRALQRLDAIPGARDLVPPESEEVGEPLAGGVVILDDQNTMAHGIPGAHAGLVGHGSRIRASGAPALRLPSGRVGTHERPTCRDRRAGDGEGTRMTGLVLLGIVVVLALVGVGLYNGLVRSRVRVDEAWSGIATQLKRRHDLIPNLVETVKGYAAHERGVLEKVTELRSRAMSATTPAQSAQAEGLLTQALRGLYAVAEGYPDLKANQNFLSLQQTLADTEGAIAGARQGYNAAVRDLNTRIESVPSNVVAGAFGFTRREFFELEDAAERAVPQVRF